MCLKLSVLGSDTYLFAQLLLLIGGLNDLKTTNFSPPRRTDCCVIRTSSIPANSSNSSNHRYLKYPLLIFIDFVFFALSNPRKIIFCPVGLYTYCIGLRLDVHSSDAPSASIPHAICSNTDSLSVFPTFRNTTAFECMPFTASCIIPSGISVPTNEDLVEPRPPDKS